jgi:peptide/nickel transport system permease protein
LSPLFQDNTEKITIKEGDVVHRFIFKRLLMLIPVLIGVIFIMFTLSYFTPGDPARIILGEIAAPEDVAQLRLEMGLDNPFIVQFFTYLWNAVQFDFGQSYQTGRDVFVELFARFPNTIQLAAMSALLAIIAGIPLGILSATRQYTVFDAGANFTGLLAASIPNFWLGMMLIIFFSVTLRVLPPSGFMTPLHWILPTITIGMSSAGTIMRFTRSSMLEVIRQDYIRTARSKGQKPGKIIFRHALKNALIPVTTVAGLQFGFLLGGAAITETIFAIPGVGLYVIQSIAMRDWPVVIGGVLLSALAFTFVNLLVDILYAFIDPRIRAQYK